MTLNIKLLCFACIVYMFSFPASSASIKNYFPQVKTFIFEEEKQTSANKPESFKFCKEFKETKFDDFFILDFEHDRFNELIEIHNVNEISISTVVIEFSKPLSNIKHKLEKNIFLDIGDRTVKGNEINSMSGTLFVDVSKVWLDLKSDKILSVKGLKTPIVQCVKKYTESELKVIENEKVIKEKERQSNIKLEQERKIIFDNCLADKLPKTNNKTLSNAVVDICKRISKNPSWWNKFWYSD